MIIGSNFKLSNRKFLDDRQQCEGLSELNLNINNYLYPIGFEVYCIREGKWYQNTSTDKNIPFWEERKGNASLDIDDVIADGEVLNNKTWSSEYIDSFKTDLELLVTNNEDYITEIEDRVIFIEGQLHWLETFDGSYNSLTDKPVIPTKTSELINDSGFAPYSELESSGIFALSHGHLNMEVLMGITEEKIAQWDNGVNSDNIFNGDYNYLDNKPINYLGDDSDIIIDLTNVANGNYIVNGTIGGYPLVNELAFIEKNVDGTEIVVILPKLFKSLLLKQEGNVWVKDSELNYQVDKDNANITNSLSIGNSLNIGENNIVAENNQIVQGKFNEEDTEGKYINIVGNGEDTNNRKNIHTLDWEGNAWYNGKVSQEGVPTEDKDLVTKGYVDGKFATNERVEQYIEKNDKENARRDVIIDALANGRKRTTNIVDGEADLLFATEKDTVFIDKIEGETLVNVCDQEEPIAITKSYTVENTNRIALQGEYDGKCRPVVNGNTLVNRNVEYDESRVIGSYINESGTEINLEGTFNSEIEISLDGHTATNLGTEKGGELCKSFESASGNEIKLTTDGNSKTDVVCQGDTLVNIGIDSSSYTYLSYESGFRTRRISLAYPVDKITIISNYSGTQLKYQINYDDENETISSFNHQSPLVAFKEGFKIKSIVIYIASADFVEGAKTEIYNLMIFEGDLTQTPELIPTEYVEGIQSTFEDKLIPYSVMTDEYESVSETQYRCDITIKPNTTYTIVSSFNLDKYQYAVYTQDELTSYVDYSETVATRTFSSDVGTIRIKTRLYPLYEGEDYSFTLSEVVGKMLIVEGDWTGRENLLVNEYFGKYKVDMQSVGKNLFDKNNINKLDYMWLGSKLGVNGDMGVISTDPYESIYWIKIKPSTTYTIQKLVTYRNRIGFSKAEPKLGVQTRGLISDNETISFPRSVTSNNDEHYLLISGFCDTNSPNITEKCTEQELLNSIQIEEGTFATEYEPYHGTTKTFYLNSPLYKGDRIEMHNGKLCHYHKMGSVVLNGSEDWTLSSVTFVNCFRCDIKGFAIPNNIDNSELNLICDRLLAVPRSSMGAGNNMVDDGDFEHITHSVIDTGYYLSINVLKSKLSTTDISGFKQWLSENPTTVVYELAEPWYEPIGEYGKVVLDGSENWKIYSNGSTTIVFYSSILNKTMSNPGIDVICDKFITNQSAFDHALGFACIDLDGDIGLTIQIEKSKLLTSDINGFKQWLSKNPTTVIYKLINPQLIDEDMTFNIATSSTLSYESNVPMGTSTFLSYVDELNLLESSTQYSVSFNCDIVGLPLVVSLGGTTTSIVSELYNTMSIITPPIETDGKLMIDGFGIANIDNVVIVKGDKAYKYFEGIKSSFEDRHIVNLWDGTFKKDWAITSAGIMSDAAVNGGLNTDCYMTNWIPCKPNTTYSVQGGDRNRWLVRNAKGEETFFGGYVGNETPTITTPNDAVELCCYYRLNSNALDVNTVHQNLAIWESNEMTYEEVMIYKDGKYRVKIKLIKSPLEFGKGGRL